MAANLNRAEILPILLDLRRAEGPGRELYVAWREAIARGMGWSELEFERRMERAEAAR